MTRGRFLLFAYLTVQSLFWHSSSNAANGFSSFDEWGTPICQDGSAANNYGIAVGGAGVSLAAFAAGGWLIGGAFAEIAFYGTEMELLSAEGKVIGKFISVLANASSKVVGRTVGDFVGPLGAVAIPMGVPLATGMTSLLSTGGMQNSRCANENMKGSPGLKIAIDPKKWKKVLIDATSAR